MSKPGKDAMLVAQLTGRIAQMLHGRTPQVTGAVLSDLTSMLIAGHVVPGDEEATRKVRGHVLKLFMENVVALLPLNVELVKKKQDALAAESKK